MGQPSSGGSRISRVSVHVCGELIFTARKRSLGQGNVFTGMCRSFCSHGGKGSLSGGGLLDRDPPTETSWTETPWTETPPALRPPLYGKERAVSILLECILVCQNFHYNKLDEKQVRVMQKKEPHETPEKWDDVLLSWMEKKNVIITAICGWSVLDTMM